VSELSQLPWQVQFADLTLGLALAISVVTDLRSRKILNLVTYPALVVSLCCFGWLGGTPFVINSLLGLLVCAGPLALGKLVRRDAMGLGDVKLMAVAGAVMGFPGALAVLLCVSVAGGLQAILWVAAAFLRGAERPAHVPYGASIALGTLVAFFWGSRLFPALSP